MTSLEFINPHSWPYFEVTGPDGKVTKYRCEMRSAHVLRSGWTKEPSRSIQQTMRITRQHTAEDPIHLKGKYSGSDVIQVATASYTQDKCKEQGLIDYSRQARR